MRRAYACSACACALRARVQNFVRLTFPPKSCILDIEMRYADFIGDLGGLASYEAHFNFIIFLKNYESIIHLLYKRNDGFDVNPKVWTKN